MQLIAQKPLYMGRNRRIMPGESFEVSDRTQANQFLESGSASIAANAPGVVNAGIPGLISCIMPTRNRREFIPRAIQCFLAQTHEAKELIILDNGESIADLVPADDRIRYIRMSSKSTTGQLRNLCCQVSRGEFIAHWDDDDWSHPERLAEQAAAIEGHQATGYNSILFHGPKPEDVTRYQGEKVYALGTSLFYRRAWWEKNRFPAVLVGEDNEFVRRSASVMKFTDGSRRIVARTHATNTSPRVTKANEWKKATKADLPEGYTA
jgi:glycosyltransferase involved in cell wall biosynthesis